MLDTSTRWVVGADGGMSVMEKSEVEKYIKNGKLAIHAKPNSSKTEILGYDESKKALRVSVAAAPDKDKANREIVKYFSKLLKKKVNIAMGLKSREKILEIN